MKYFIFKVYEENYNYKVNSSWPVLWKQHHSSLKTDDVIFVYITNKTNKEKRKFICILKVNKVQKIEKNCMVYKKQGISKAQSDKVINANYDRINKLPSKTLLKSETKLEDKKLLKYLLDTEK